MSDSSNANKTEDDLQQSLIAEPAEQEFSLTHYSLPDFVACKREWQTSTAVKSYVFVSMWISKWDSVKKRSRRDGRVVVGRIEGNQEFGRVAFKADFIKKYPQLKDITVICKSAGIFVVVNKPYDGSTFESMLGHAGRPHKIVNNPQTAVAATTLPKFSALCSGRQASSLAVVPSKQSQDTTFVFKPTNNELGWATTSWGQVRLRPVQESDAVEIMAIYAPYVLHTAVSFENNVPSVAEIVSRIRARARRYPYIVAETVPQNAYEESLLLGYAYASAFHEREAYRYSAEMSIYIDQAYQRDGLGRALYSCLELVLRLQGFTNLYACIAYNEALALHLQDIDPYLTLDSVHFHKRMGFRLNGVFHRCGYKFGRWFDMCWMEKLLEPLTNPVCPREALLSCDEAYARLAQL